MKSDNIYDFYQTIKTLHQFENLFTMSKDFAFSDTFDNFSFSESGRPLSKDNICAKLDLNSKHVTDTREKNVINISVDDSVFLNEFISPYEVNINNEGSFDTSLKDSEELFADSPEKTYSNCNNDGNKSVSNLVTKLDETILVLSKNNIGNRTAINLEPITSKSIEKEPFEISVDDSVFINEFLSPSPKINKSKNKEINSQTDHKVLCSAIAADNITAVVENNVDNLIATEDLASRNCNFNASIKSATEISTVTKKQDVSNNENNATAQSQHLIINKNEDTAKAALTLRADVPALSNNCSLSAWGLPNAILQKYESRGIISMFQWQAKCLENPHVLQHGSNLVYSAPTSAGKTLVAEILAIKTVLERHKKVLFILPFVSVVREKMFYFQDILGSTGVRVEGFMGSHNPPGGFQTVQVAICTIEKANGIINRLLEENALSDIGAVIIDELHLLGDYSRGYLLELMLTKLQYMSVRYENIQIQIIGMSATLPNLELLGKWLKAQLFVTDFRPIPLYEQCLVGKEIYNKNLQLERQLQSLPELETDTDNILQLCLETIQNSCSVLIFCPTKNWCENLSQQIAMAFWKLGSSKSPFGLILRDQLNCNLIKELLEQLKCCPVGLDKMLGKSVSYGVAFHHAGLTMDERDIIEAAFRNGVLRVLIATSTLSSGVNLPARRVIIRSPMFHGKPIDSLVYRQMIGRAGRMGKDLCGESVLICQKTDYRIAKELLSANLQPIESCLEGSGRLKRAILEVVASGVAATPDDVNLFTNCTLLAASEVEKEDVLQDPIEESLEFLLRNEFIRLQKLEDGTFKYIPTSLGKACLSSSMPPEEGLALFSELEKARQCFVLETELHIIYIVTPYSVCNQWVNLDWLLFLELWEKLSASMRRVGELVGISESYVINATRNKIQTNTSKLYQKLQIHRRFFTALALQDLVNEVPLNDVAIKFGCSRGMLQSLQQSASTFAGMLTIFSRQLGWSSIEILVSQFQDRLQFGISRDLLDLMRLPILNGPRARALYNAGIETLANLASSDVYIVENVLHKVVPFESEKEREGESEFDAKQRNKVRSVFVTGKDGLTEREAAIMLIEDARRYLQLELGLAEAKWEFNKPDSVEELKHTQKNILEKPLMNNVNINLGSEENNGSDQHEVINLSTSLVLQLSPDLSNIQTPATSINKSKTKIQLNNTKEKLSFNNTSNASDQSLFGDSFEQHMQFSNYEVTAKSCSVNDEDKENCKLDSENNLSNAINSGDSGLDFENGSFLENAFMTSFDLGLEESNGKISDVVADSPDSNVSKNLSVVTGKKDSGFDLINNSRCETSSILSLKNLSGAGTSRRFSLKVSRKRDRMDKKNPHKTCVIDEDESSFIKQTPTKRRKVQTQKTNTKSSESSTSQDQILNYKSTNCTATDLTKFHVIDVCSDKKLFKTFCDELLEQQILSLSFACSNISENNALIGANIIGTDVKEQRAPVQFTYKNRNVVGVVLTWGSNTAYYIHFNNAGVISNTAKTDMLKKLLVSKTLKVRMFDSKEQIKVAKLCCDFDFSCGIEDPKVVDWLIEPEGKEKNLQAMALKYAPETVSLSQLAGNCKGVGSVGLDLYSTIEPRIRAAVEAVVTWHLCESLYDALIQQNSKLLETYNVEMGTVLCLAHMELNGIGVNMTKLQALADNLKQQSVNIEKQAYALAGHHFSFTSPKDVAKVLGIYKGGKKVCTNKQTLEQQDHPIAKLILLWRKLNSALTKMVYPLIRLVQNNRIYGCCVTHSATGRISMHEPNLQNIPRDFEVQDFITNSKNIISCRTAFVPETETNWIFLSADYCQLELRLLTHFSQDPLLCTIMKSDEDVFKSVAAKWKNIQEKEVDDVMRQWAKQLCYGIIYGMGVRALADQLSVSEEEASNFLESFRERYPFIKEYTEDIVNKCRDLGYVETLSGRRRYLPHINHKNPAMRSQAERQAVNTTVQGSAADIAKKAMMLIDDRFQNKFRQSKNLPKLVLHLHDELLYEVQEKYLLKTAKILKQSMEETVKLSVPFPVKLKSGLSWGTMEDLVL